MPTMRYKTNHITVTGSSPDELETEAVKAAALRLARPEGMLTAMPGYIVYEFTSREFLPKDGLETQARTLAKPGHTLYAMVQVAEYLPAEGGDDDGPGDLGSGDHVPADHADLRPASDPAALRRPAPLEARAAQSRS